MGVQSPVFKIIKKEGIIMRKLVDVVSEYGLCGLSLVSFIIFMGEIFHWLLYV